MNPIEPLKLEPNEPLALKEELAPEIMELTEPGAQSFAPIEVDVTVLKDEENVVSVTGTVKTTLKLQCGRCGEMIPWPVRARVDHLFEPPQEILVDLVPYFREDVLLELPLIPACRLGADSRCPITGETHLPKAEASMSLASEALWDALSKIKPKK